MSFPAPSSHCEPGSPVPYFSEHPGTRRPWRPLSHRRSPRRPRSICPQAPSCNAVPCLKQRPARSPQGSAQLSWLSPYSLPHPGKRRSSVFPALPVSPFSIQSSEDQGNADFFCFAVYKTGGEAFLLKIFERCSFRINSGTRSLCTTASGSVPAHAAHSRRSPRG